MQLEAIYEQGRLEFTQPVHFKHDRVRLVVYVADEEVIDTPNVYDLPPAVLEKAREMRDRLDQVRNAPLPPDDELPPVSAKTLERIEAFELREDR